MHHITAKILIDAALASAQDISIQTFEREIFNASMIMFESLQVFTSVELDELRSLRQSCWAHSWLELYRYLENHPLYTLAHLPIRRQVDQAFDALIMEGVCESIINREAEKINAIGERNAEN